MSNNHKQWIDDNQFNTQLPREFEKKISLKSPAKINLFFNINDHRKENNHHIINSLMAFLDLSDTIEININPKSINDDQLIILGEFKHMVDCQMKDNLLFKTISSFYQYFNLTKLHSFQITLYKNIPVGAGLGGGSSNAAEIIKFLFKYHNINPSAESIRSFCNLIGADVYFFIADTAKYVYNIGDTLHHIEQFQPMPAILLYPKLVVLSKDSYSYYKQSNQKYSKISEKIEHNDLITHSMMIKYLEDKKNDLQTCILNKYPQLEALYRLFTHYIKSEDNKSIVRMTGSGSCFFILPSTPENRIKLLSSLNKMQTDHPEHKDLWIKESLVLYNFINHSS